MTVRKGVVYTTYKYSPAEARVVNVYGLDERKTSLLEATGKFKEDDNAWMQGWLDSDDPSSLDWESRPKQGDYLGRIRNC